MDLREFFLALGPEQREAFAFKAGTTVNYLLMHVITRRKTPRPDLINGLVGALAQFGAPITRTDLIVWLHEPATT